MKTRHLHLVTDEPLARSYIVVRTSHVQPGTPRVVAEIANVGIAIESPYAGAEVFAREDMESDPSLAEALRAWEQRDDVLFAREVAAFEIAERHRRAPARRAHPSAQSAERWVPV